MKNYKILFDVGANFGTHSLDKIKNTNDWICFAFEPTPKLVQHLLNQSKHFSDRYYVLPYAISDFNGTSDFHIAGQADWGCSSLLEFSHNLSETWPGRTDFKVTETINVKVITLQKFIEELCPIKISHIDYFHCDTQGSDLKVLKGLGQYINLIEEGVVEAANKEDILYFGQNTAIETGKYLQKHKFITYKYSNDCFNNEVNINFKKEK